jgi:hypothetical protein
VCCYARVAKRQTHYLEVVAPQGVEVRLLSRAPHITKPSARGGFSDMLSYRSSITILFFRVVLWYSCIKELIEKDLLFLLIA